MNYRWTSSAGSIGSRTRCEVDYDSWIECIDRWNLLMHDADGCIELRWIDCKISWIDRRRRRARARPRLLRGGWILHSHRWIDLDRSSFEVELDRSVQSCRAGGGSDRWTDVGSLATSYMLARSGSTYSCKRIRSRSRCQSDSDED